MGPYVTSVQSLQTYSPQQASWGLSSVTHVSNEVGSDEAGLTR